MARMLRVFDIRRSYKGPQGAGAVSKTTGWYIRSNRNENLMRTVHIVQASVYSILSHLLPRQGLYPSSERIDLKKLRKLIIDGRLVACYPGLEESNSASCDEVSNALGVKHAVMLQTFHHSKFTMNLNVCPFPLINRTDGGVPHLHADVSSAQHLALLREEGVHRMLSPGKCIT